jgi:hypothetical protein
LGNCAFRAGNKEYRGVKHVNDYGSEGNGGQLNPVIDNLRGIWGQLQTKFTDLILPYIPPQILSS